MDPGHLIAELLEEESWPLMGHHPSKSSWSLGQDVFNTIGTDGGSCDSGIEYYVTLGHDNDHDYEAFDDFRIFKIVDGDIVMDTPMDSTADGTLYVYDGSGWDEVTYSCNSADAGPCWEAGDETPGRSREPDPEAGSGSGEG